MNREKLFKISNEIKMIKKKEIYTEHRKRKREKKSFIYFNTRNVR